MRMGGVYVLNGQVTFAASNVFGNTAGNTEGGGVFVENGRVTWGIGLSSLLKLPSLFRAFLAAE